MTEAEWLSCIEPEKMLDFLCYDLFPKKVDGRKEYLMSAACCRLIWPLIRDERSRRAIVEAEVMADHPDLPELPGDVVSEAQAAYIESCHKEGEDERPAYAAFKASFKSPHAQGQRVLNRRKSQGFVMLDPEKAVLFDSVVC